MTNTTVIVAIPGGDDKVNRISSEKVPHLTLVSLGDQFTSNELISIVEYVEHAASQLSPFGLTVDYRGTLGENAADVVFFEKDNWSYPRISDFRHWLLSNDTIKTKFDSSDQFPEWNPHLTLGYPETPAKPDESDYPGISYVNFDRIAVWMDDSEGPTFRLKYENDGMDSPMAMSDMTTTKLGGEAVAELFHYGKKGMKWGVRNDKGHEGEKVKTKNLDKLDKKWEAEQGRSAYMKLYNKAADKMNNGGIDAINNKPEYKDADLSKPGELQDKYYAEHETAFQKAMVAAGPSLGMNPSGTKAFVIKKVTDPETGEEYDDLFLEPVGKTIKHAEGDKVQVFRLPRNATGHILEYIEEEAELKHYGKKGMKWGVTTVDKATSPTLTRERDMKVLNTKDVTVTQRRSGTYVKTRGGQRQKATDDAVKAAAARQKAKKSTTDSLTNDELKTANERMRLEQEFSKLNSKTKRRGQSFVARLFATPEVRAIAADTAKKVAKAAAE